MLMMPNINENCHLNFRLLRNYCMKYHKANIFGIITNFKEWSFTRYSLHKELVQVQRMLAEKSYWDYSPFSMSESYHLMESSENSIIDTQALAKILAIIEHLSIYKFKEDDNSHKV